MVAMIEAAFWAAAVSLASRRHRPSAPGGATARRAVGVAPIAGDTDRKDAMTATAGFLAERNVHGVGAAVRSDWTYNPNRGTTDRTAAARRSPRQSRGSGGSVRTLTLSRLSLRDSSSTRQRRGRGRCRTHGRADAPTGPCKTAPTRFRTSAHRHHLFPDHQTGSDRPGERRPDFYVSTWLPTTTTCGGSDGREGTVALRDVAEASHQQPVVAGFEVSIDGRL